MLSAPQPIDRPESERLAPVLYGKTARAARLHSLLPARRPPGRALSLHVAPVFVRGDYEGRLSSWDAGL